MGLYENKNGVLSPIAGRGNIDGVYKANGILGAKNMLNVKASTAEIQGVTYTVNSDKTITVNGTATASSTIQLSGGDRYKIPTTDGLVVHKGNSDSVHILIWYYDSNKNYLGDSYAQDTTEEKLKLIIPEGAVYFECALRVYSNQTVSNVMCKPMLTLESDTDSTYQPYAMTNKELTEDVDVINSQIKQTAVIGGEISRLVTNSLRGTTGSNRVIHFDFRGDGIGILTWRSNNANSVYLVSNKEGTFSATKISGTDLIINSADLSDVTITSGQGGIICAVHCVASTWAYKSNSY